MAITVISYPDNILNETYTEGTSSNSLEIIKNVWIDVSEATTDEYIEITYNGVVTTLYIQDESKHEPIDIAFVNKSGAEQFLTFFKKKTSDMKVKSEDFESDRGQPIDGNHQFVKYNVNGKSKFKVNSGFVYEELNETFKQLLLSEQVWHYDGDKFIPLNVSSSSLSYKTRQNDRLISYEIEFEYSYNEINNI